MKKNKKKNKIGLKILAGVLGCLFIFVFVARRTSSTMTVEHTFDAPTEKVWKLWNDPEAIKKWWSPKGYTAPTIRSDFRVNGTYLLSMQSPSGDITWNSGTYKEIVAGQKIVSTLSFSDENGKPIPGSEVKVPGVWPDEVTVTVEFKDLNGKTRVTIQEVGIPLIMKQLSKMGWNQQFEKFESLL